MKAPRKLRRITTTRKVWLDAILSGKKQIEYRALKPYWAQRLSGISDFSHSRPGRADGDMRDSNGPIYVRSVFEHAAWIHFEVIGLCFVLALVARPKLLVPPPVIDLFGDETRVQSRVTRAAFEELCSAEA